jgi:hypothetical protein
MKNKTCNHNSEPTKWQPCRECERLRVKAWNNKNKEKHVKSNRNWKTTNPAKYKAVKLAERAKKYGITIDQLNILLDAGCAICGSTDRLHIDHNHATGKVRAALCQNCNLALGLIKDSPERCESMANYLRSF